MLGAAGAIGSGGVNVINNSAPSISPIVVQQGGSDVTQISFGGTGNGDNKSLSIYGFGNYLA